MPKLTSAKRRALPRTDFVVPGQKPTKNQTEAQPIKAGEAKPTGIPSKQKPDNVDAPYKIAPHITRLTKKKSVLGY